MKQTVRDLHNYMNNKSSNKYHALVTSSFSKTKGFFCFSLNKRSPKDTLGKLSFLHMLFLENEAQINKNNCAMMFFMSYQVSLPKISSLLQKKKIGPKCYICPFCTKAFNYLSPRGHFFFNHANETNGAWETA